jgi:hypothetical protein
MKTIKNLNPQKSKFFKGFNKQTYFQSFIKHEDFFIFGCGSNGLSNGIAVYDKT